MSRPKFNPTGLDVQVRNAEMSEEDALFDVWSWLNNPEADWWSIHLIRLIAKSDMRNRAKLSHHWPMMVAVVTAYQQVEGYAERSGLLQARKEDD